MRERVLALLCAAGCGSRGADILANEGFEITCDIGACDWTVVEGQAGSGSWHEGDVGLDLSGAGQVIVEQRSAGFGLPARDLSFEASIVRDPGVELRFDLAWYAPGAGAGSTFWDRGPALLDTLGDDPAGGRLPAAHGGRGAVAGSIGPRPARGEGRRWPGARR